MRPRFNGKRAFNDPKYSAYKKGLAAGLNAVAGFFSWDFPAPASKERSKWLQENRYQLAVQVYSSARRGDLSNFIKCIEDALQDAGVIADDVQIDGYLEPTFKTIDKANPRVEIQLYKAEMV